MSNRLQAIAELPNQGERGNAYEALRQRIEGWLAWRLTADEVELLCREVETSFQPGAVSPWCLTALWMLLFTARGSARVRELAYRCLATPEAPRRGLAFTYLYTEFPNEIPALLQQCEPDPDPDLRAAVAGYFYYVAGDPRRALHLYLDALAGPLDQSARDGIELSVVGSGTAEHLARLRQLETSDPAGASYWRMLAEGLESNLRQRSNP